MEIKRVKHYEKLPSKIRVCAYARVSSGKDSMLHSLGAQVSYYNSLIQSHSDWIFSGIYADEAISGTKDTREQFNRMILDAKVGLIDMVITKSISRFARNTVTLLKAIRELKECKVDVYFEEQNLHSISKDGELLLTLLASFAQEETRSVSRNMRWRVAKNFEEGKNYSLKVLGYDLKDGVLYINKEEKPIIEYIFARFLEGKGRQVIANELNKMGYKTKVGMPFQQTSVGRILSNVIYKGDLDLWKRYRLELSQGERKNNGEFDKFYIEEAHEPIIAREVFDRVQEMLKARRLSMKKPEPNGTPFSGKIFCGIDGNTFIRCNTGTRPCWKCSRYKKGGPAMCPSKQIGESELYEAIDALMDRTSFFERIVKIVVFPDYRLDFIFRDGEIVNTNYRLRSRRESWTPEMREKARLATERRNSNA